jgi:hypothetical protein
MDRGKKEPFKKAYGSVSLDKKYSISGTTKINYFFHQSWNFYHWHGHVQSQLYVSLILSAIVMTRSNLQTIKLDGQREKGTI